MPIMYRGFRPLCRLAAAISGAALLTFGLGAWPSVLADSSPIGTPSSNEFGLNNFHNQVIENAANRNFTANWTLTGPTMMDPVIIHGVLYGDTSNPPYGAIAVNPVNGHVIWFHPFPNQMMNSPIYNQGTLYFGLGNNKFPDVPVVAHPDLRGTGVNQVVAINAQTGVTQWVYNTAGEDMPSFVLYHQGLYVANGADQVLDLSPATGQVIRSLAIPSYVSMSSPTVIGHTAYFGGAFPYNMYAVNLNTLKITWDTHTRSVGGLDDASPVANRQNVYTGTVYDDNGQSTAMLLAFNRANGKIRWATRLGIGVRPTQGALYETGVPLLHHGVVYAGSSVSDAVYALNAVNGSVLWWNQLNHKAIAQAPVLIDHRLLVGDGAGTLFVLNPQNGDVLYSMQFGGGFMPGVPFVDGNTMFFGSRNGTFFARPISQLIAGK